MSFSNQKFLSSINGETVEDLNKKIDYSKVKLEDRKENINQILENTDFYEEYFDNYYKSSINSNESLSSEVNVCSSLERMANYLLSSNEVKEQEKLDNKKNDYTYHTNKKYFQKKIDREASLSQIMKLENEEGEEYENNIIHHLKKPEKNYKLKKKQTADLKGIRVSKVNSEENVIRVKDIINQYQNFIDHITEKLISKEYSLNRYLLAKTKGNLTDDIIMTKNCLLGFWGAKRNPSNETRKPNLDVFDFTNIKHVLGTHLTYIGKKGKETKIKVNGLMYFKPQELDPEDDFTFVLYDFNETVKQANLTQREKQVLERLRNGLREVDIEREMNISRKTVRYDIDIISKKIIRIGNKYDYE